jgi:hypothetical protein
MRSLTRAESWPVQKASSRAGVAQFEAHALLLRVAFDVDQRVLARVAAVVGRAMLLAHRLQAEDFARKAVGADGVARAQAHVADVQQIDHGGPHARRLGAHRDDDAAKV